MTRATQNVPERHMTRTGMRTKPMTICEFDLVFCLVLDILVFGFMTVELQAAPAETLDAFYI